MIKSFSIAGALLVLLCGAAHSKKPSPGALKLCICAKGLNPEAISNAALLVARELDNLGITITSRQEKVTNKSICCRTSSCILAAGRSLGVSWVVNVSVIRVGPLVSITFRTFDALTGRKRFQTSLATLLQDFPQPAAIRSALERTLEVLRMDEKAETTGAEKKPTKR